SEPPAVAGGPVTEPLAVASGSSESRGVLSEPPAVAGGPVTEPPAVAGGLTHDVAETSELPTLARHVVETFISTGIVFDTPEDLSELFNARAGCFVSIKTLNGDLRGCIGTIEPVKD